MGPGGKLQPTQNARHNINPMKKPCDRFRFRQQSVQTNLVATAKAMKPCASKGIMIRTPPTPTGGRQLD